MGWKMELIDGYLRPTPWDKRNFHVETYELAEAGVQALQATNETEGHFTLKVDPSANTEQLNKYGFYYVDTLIEPACRRENLHIFNKEDIQLSADFDRDEVLEIAKESFKGGRFHRDFNIPDFMADQRYMNWVSDLIIKDMIVGLYFQGELAGFYGYANNKVLLLAIKKEFRQEGLAKPFTSHAVWEQFEQGEYEMLTTSISASNMKSLNLFLSLGFRPQGAVDVYHKLNGSLPVGVS
ncbi:N-acetyltransferase [Virgibacillus sp. YIM 98842]|uniref:N-acetyltransferase n=1 Tax=Virgibacillus sp. YIM 98842 TaxID=2663533 RepID=UPI001F090D10|nr:N-acetyltransferase [Virgibacillus sp. YIM 98842]